MILESGWGLDRKAAQHACKVYLYLIPTIREGNTARKICKVPPSPYMARGFLPQATHKPVPGTAYLHIPLNYYGYAQPAFCSTTSSCPCVPWCNTSTLWPTFVQNLFIAQPNPSAIQIFCRGHVPARLIRFLMWLTRSCFKFTFWL